MAITSLGTLCQSPPPKARRVFLGGVGGVPSFFSPPRSPGRGGVGQSVRQRCRVLRRHLRAVL